MAATPPVPPVCPPCIPDRAKLSMSAARDIAKHVAYCQSHLTMLPNQMTCLDTNRLSLVFFAVSSLDLLGSIHTVDKKAIIEWIYNLQVLPSETDAGKYSHCAGFIGGTFLGTSYDAAGASNRVGAHHPLNHGHLAMNYFALATLAILGDKFERVKKDAIVGAIKTLQRNDGSFAATAFGSEADMRFLYCACASSFMLNDWRGVDIAKAVDYIKKAQSFDNAIGLLPGQESHGGSTYCAVAALELMGELKALPHRDGLIDWCVRRQVSGFQGRRQKDPDTCYSFWVGATLALIGAFDLIDVPSCRAFHERCKKGGGFCKLPTSRYPDPLHSYFSICAMAMMREPGFRPLHSALCISQRAAKSVASIQQKKKTVSDATQPYGAQATNVTMTAAT